MRILVIFTGGTIGCAAPSEDSVLDVLQDKFLIKSYDNPHDVEFRTQEPIERLSENMTIDDWNVLLKCLKNVKFSEYDGIIITHGTDTMAFTASMFGMLFAGIDIPVIFIGSYYELTDERADGHKNFANAVDFIKDVKLGGTFVIMKEKVYLSTRISQAKHFVSDFDSPDGTAFGTFKNGSFELSNSAVKSKDDSTINPSVNRTVDNNIKENSATENILTEASSNNKSIINQIFDNFQKLYEKTPIINRIDSISNCVFLIRPYVGLNYGHFNFTKEIKAVLHETYHSATACVETEKAEYSVLEFHKKHKDSIKLYLTPFYSKIIEDNTALKYSSTASMMNAGIKTICDMSLESAYAKLLIAYSLFDDENQIDEFLNETLFFEKIC